MKYQFETKAEMERVISIAKKKFGVPEEKMLIKEDQDAVVLVKPRYRKLLGGWPWTT